ncbi:ATP-dependent DNA helicase [Candidatus Woesearchaeota archaeon]|nr:ATP-dependent DNA helicase [Candidatus Woesearchaeota archaeon]
MLFPHDTPRPGQKELLDDIYDAIQHKRCHIAHAPTGLGKTAASLGAALTYAVEHDKKVFFLTSRHTQHTIAIDTVKSINRKQGCQIKALDIIGRQKMCPVQGTQTLYSREFSEYCKAVREDMKCSFYVNTRTKNGGLTVRAKGVMGELMQIQPFHAEELQQRAQEQEMCPYEVTLAMAKKAQVIVTDYYYVFSPSVRDVFFSKMEIDLEDCIVIVDEAHNLPGRIRELMTQKLSTLSIKRAITEAKKFGFDDALHYLERIQQIMVTLAKDMKQDTQQLMSKRSFQSKIEELTDYKDLVQGLSVAGDSIRETQKQSAIGAIASFLQGWLGEDIGYVRILERRKESYGEYIMLSYQCLDPSIISKETIDACHSVICMSGTLTPTSMYKDVLGFPVDTTEKEYTSPFPQENRLVIINPSVTTKFSARSEQQFHNIARLSADIANHVPGNTAIFFPSYQLKTEISPLLSSIVEKTVFEEYPGATKEEKSDLIERFKSYKDTGAVLLAVSSGSYGEGIDLPGDLLKAVIVVGIALQPPTLEVKELIEYYERKFGKGWDYGYTLPAISTSLQNAGRCIRTENDKGVIAFLDVRYSFQNYLKCFPYEWNPQITNKHEKLIKYFFNH